MECLRTHGHIIEPVEIGKGLRVRLVLDEFFSSSVEETDVLCRQEEVHLIDISCMYVWCLLGLLSGFLRRSVQGSCAARRERQDAGDFVRRKQK